MIISDLNHLEVISEETNIVGGGISRPVLRPYARATSGAEATAIGTRTITDTGTLTEAVSGLFSHSISVSSSQAWG